MHACTIRNWCIRLGQMFDLRYGGFSVPARHVRPGRKVAECHGYCRDVHLLLRHPPLVLTQRYHTWYISSMSMAFPLFKPSPTGTLPHCCTTLIQTCLLRPFCTDYCAGSQGIARSVHFHRVPGARTYQGRNVLFKQCFQDRPRVEKLSYVSNAL